MKCFLPMVLFATLLAGCDDMASQPKSIPFDPSKLFPDGKAMQAPPEGTVSRDALVRDAALASQPTMTLALLERGRERFDVFCSPCHGRDGDGDGAVVRRGFPRPPTYHQDRLREAPDSHFMDVIANGYGAMYAYGDRVPPSDRWAIVAYIRALQESRNANIAELPEVLQRKLEGRPY